MDQPNNPDSPDHVRPSAANPAPANNGPSPAPTSSAGTGGPAPTANRPRNDDSAAPPAPPLTFAGWLSSNGPYLVIFLVAAGLIYRAWGIDGLVYATKAVVGLGFVIFIHELGHFLTAKWCDVHVQTFSIGFGPALPGCSFQYGETTYKIAALPLGGFVNMVGEGPEADEDEDYPRSFKNKSVGQRMLIISAGVIMNVVFGFLCFVVVYRYHGVSRAPAVIGRVEAGSAAWEGGMRSGWAITTIDGKKRTWFDEMKIAVALSPSGRAIPFGFKTREGTEVIKEIEPRRDGNNLMPMLGVTPAKRLKLFPPAAVKQHQHPYSYNSAAAFARSFDLRPGDEVVKATDPAREGARTALPAGARGWRELCKRLRKLDGQPVVLEVRRAGALVTVEAGSGFEWSDIIAGTTDPSSLAKGPFEVKELPPALSLDGKPVQDNDGNVLYDPFEFFRRMRLLAGKPAVIQVRRADSSATDAPVNVLVPPEFHLDFGMRMMMGDIAAVRIGSKAEEAGVPVIKGASIVGAAVQFAGESSSALVGDELDPVRLPDALASRIYGDKEKRDPNKWSVILTIVGSDKGNQGKKRTFTIPWDASWRFDDEPPFSASSPLAIPELGIAYRVTSTVVEVKEGSPAKNAGIQPNDQVQELRQRDQAKNKDAETSWGKWIKLKSTRDQDDNVYDQWAHYFWAFQEDRDFPEIQVKVFRGGALLDPMTLTGEQDESWPEEGRGLILTTDSRRQQASTMWEAVTFGVDHTTGLIKQIYLYLSSMLQRRISPRSLGGPIEIASQAFNVAGEDVWVFLLFLGMISINLAVVNFLPIPVLDGGHMVFLIYEKLRGKPPSENVRAIATYMGLAFILLLMLFVFYLDIKRRIGLPW